jgi:hypothetical protein
LSTPALVAFYALGTVASFGMASEGAFGSSLSGETDLNWGRIAWLRPITLWSGCAIVLLVFMLAAARGRGKRGVALVAVAMIAVNLVLASLSGSRSAILGTVLLVFAGITYGRFPVRKIRTVVRWGMISAIALGAGVLVITPYRYLRWQTFGQGERVSLGESASLVVESVKSVKSLGKDERSSLLTESLLERFSALENLAVTLGRFKELKNDEVERGMDHNIRNELLWGFVPRALYPAKPMVGMFGADFSALYLDLPGQTFNGPTVVGDLYRNGGPVGVAVGMAFMGIVLRWLYQRLILEALGYPMAALYFVVLSYVGWESRFASFFTEGLRALVPLVVLTLALEVFNVRRGPNTTPRRITPGQPSQRLYVPSR